ncbi:Cocaine esterase [Mactra antiquata]
MAKFGLIVVLCSILLCKIHGQEERFVTTPVGTIKGFTDTLSFDGKTYSYTKFLGIPFAESTEGFRRFAKPVKKAPFAEIYDATEEKHACVQNPLWDQNPPPSSEDCLNLNIFVPANVSVNNPSPVMLFIFGGGFQQGYQNPYGIGALPVVNDVIYVTINYRVSIFGFLAHDKLGLKGNYGLWDQQMGIQWVHDNIASFGGSPDHVTIFGESAGGASVIYQALYEGNIGLFRSVIAESGAPGAYWSYAENLDDLSGRVIEALDCMKESTDDTLECLRMKTADEITSVLSGAAFPPVHDNDFLKYDPAHLYDASIPASRDALAVFGNFDAIIGINSNESALEIFYAFTYGLFENNITFPDGLTPELAKNFLIYNFKTMNMDVDDSIVNSIIHEYTDWSDPRNPFKISEQVGDLLSDISFVVPAISALTAHASEMSSARTYMYYFEHRPSYSMSPPFMKGASHMEEIPFVLGFPESFMKQVSASIDDVTDSEIALSRKMMTYWSQFATTGNPNSDPSNPTWPEYEVDSQKYIIFRADQTPLPTAQHLIRRQVNYWNNVYPHLVKSVSDNEWKDWQCVASSAAQQTISLYSLIGLVILLFI